MTIDEDESGQTSILGLTGKVDIIGTDQLARRLNDLLDRGARFVVLDFRDVTYINSAGLCALIAVGKRVAKSGGGLVLAEVNPQIQRVLQMSGLLSFFKLHSTRAEALDAFQQ